MVLEMGWWGWDGGDGIGGAGHLTWTPTWWRAMGSTSYPETLGHSGLD